MAETGQRYPEWEWEVAKGDDDAITGAYTNDDGSIEPLTNCDVQCQIRSRPGGRLYLNLTSTPAAGITIDEAAGTFEIVITDTQTLLFDWKYAWYSVAVKAADDTIRTLFHGKMKTVEVSTIWGSTV